MTKATKRRSKRANVTVTETTYLPSIIKKLNKLAAQEVLIGATGDAETAMIAAIHEFGSKKAGIPARSFVGTGKQKAQAAIGKLARAGVNSIILKSETGPGLLNKIGEIGRERMLKNFDKIKTPPLTARYAKRKGNNKILRQEEQLRGSISFVVVPSKRGRK